MREKAMGQRMVTVMRLGPIRSTYGVSWMSQWGQKMRCAVSAQR